MGSRVLSRPALNTRAVLAVPRGRVCFRGFGGADQHARAEREFAGRSVFPHQDPDFPARTATTQWPLHSVRRRWHACPDPRVRRGRKTRRDTRLTGPTSGGVQLSGRTFLPGAPPAALQKTQPQSDDRAITHQQLSGPRRDPRLHGLQRATCPARRTRHLAQRALAGPFSACFIARPSSPASHSRCWGHSSTSAPRAFARNACLACTAQARLPASARRRTRQLQRPHHSPNCSVEAPSGNLGQSLTNGRALETQRRRQKQEQPRQQPDTHAAQFVARQPPACTGQLRVMTYILSPASVLYYTDTGVIT